MTEQERVKLVEGLEGSALEEQLKQAEHFVQKDLRDVPPLGDIPEPLVFSVEPPQQVETGPEETKTHLEAVGEREEIELAKSKEFMDKMDELKTRRKQIVDDILDNKIWVYKKNDEGENTTEKEWIQLRDFMDEKFVHVYEDERKDGVEMKGIVLDEGVELIEKKVGAKEVAEEQVVNNVLSRQEVRDGFVLTNQYPQYVLIKEMKFDDGSTHSGTGEANIYNCSSFIAKKNMYIMAQKRARHRAVLRSDRVGLKHLYSEVESEEFSKSASLQRELQQAKQEMNKKVGEARAEVNKFKRDLAQANKQVMQMEQLKEELAKAQYSLGAAREFIDAFVEEIHKLGMEEQFVGALRDVHGKTLQSLLKKIQKNQAG